MTLGRMVLGVLLGATTMGDIGVSPSRRRRKPPWLAKLWRHCTILWWERSEDLRRAQDALSNLEAAAQNHLTLPSRKSRNELRGAYDAALFFVGPLQDAGVRDLALYAIYQSAMALGPAAELGGEALLYVRDEIRRSHEAAHRAILDYLDDLMTGNV